MRFFLKTLVVTAATGGLSGCDTKADRRAEFERWHEEAHLRDAGHGAAGPREDCYWLVRLPNRDKSLLVDRHPESPCAVSNSASTETIKVGDADELVTFAAKAGRRVCGQVVEQCPDAGHWRDRSTKVE